MLQKNSFYYNSILIIEKWYVDNPPQINDKEIARMLIFEKNSPQINENKQKLAAKK